MSRNQRLGLLALVVLVAVAAFVIAKPGGSDDTQEMSSSSKTAGSKTTTGGQNATTAEQPAVQRVVIKGGKPVGGVRSIKVTKGDRVRIEVSADAPNLLHLHGYDIEKKATLAKPATFSFKADNEGEFELESHTAEHAGQEPLMARLLVQPS